MKRFLSVLGVGVLSLGVLAACGEANVQKVSSGGQKNEQTKEEKKPEVYHIGDTVSVDGMEITLKSAKFTNPNQYVEAKNGKVLMIEVQVKNNGDTNALVDNTDFNIADASGNQFEQYYGFDDASSFSHDLKKGNQIQGKIAFDVKDADKYILYYEPAFSLKDNAEIKFEISKNELQ